MAYANPLDERARASRRKHYELNREQYYERNLEKARKIKAYILKLKNEGECADCQARYPDEPWLFEFDHVRGVKKYTISTVHKRSWKLMLEELAKCDMVCVLCHRRRTASRAGWKAGTDDERDSDG